MVNINENIVLCVERIWIRFAPLLLMFHFSAFGESGENASSEPQVLQALEIDKVWSGHPVGFHLLTHGQYQFAAYYDAERQMAVASRKLDETTWNKKILPSKLGWDSHNYVTMALDREGFIHVSGNMHGIPLVYFRSAEPYNIQTLEPAHKMTGDAEQRVTYPRFLQDAQGNLLFTYRDGGSGNGNNPINIYDEKTRIWKRFLDVPLFDGKGEMNAYFSGPLKGPDNLFHIAWMWRDTPDCATNHDISYMKSPDLKHWISPGGKIIPIPVTPDNKDVIVDPAPP
ncbi:BNR repeat-containing protein, partial [Candidatus Sumerlaeota bacterium]|nr:BNR repeat-containing protein [Candidatus Sumerlaeota bacterium]